MASKLVERRNELLDRLDETESKCAKLEERYHKVTSHIKEDKIRRQIHPLHEDMESTLRELWAIYFDLDDDVELIDESKKRMTWCDSEWHFLTTKDDNLLGGFRCDCE